MICIAVVPMCFIANLQTGKLIHCACSDEKNTKASYLNDRFLIYDDGR